MPVSRRSRGGQLFPGRFLIGEIGLLRTGKNTDADRPMVYLPLAYPTGNGQIDFGGSIYYDGKGQEQKGFALTVSFHLSNKGYTQFFPS